MWCRRGNGGRAGDLRCGWQAPACGTTGFLVSAADYISKNYEYTMTAEQWEHFSGEMFTGYDTERVWFYDMKADGFSLDDKRSEVSDNDIPDIIQRFHNLDAEKDRDRTEQSFFVPKQEIVDNGYDLSINKYKKTEYVPVEYPPASEILDKLDELEEEIAKDLKELRGML